MRLPWKREARGLPGWYLDMLAQVSYNGSVYGVGLQQTYSAGQTEAIEGNFPGLTRGAYKQNSVVFSCLDVRQKLFSEARFQFRRISAGTPGDLWGNPELRILERPWPNGTTGDLLARMEQDSSLAGNFYARRVGQTLYHLRPDWVLIVLGSNVDEENPAEQWDATVIGYAYFPGGIRKAGVEPLMLGVDEVVHYAPIPDPEARYRGMSWLTPVIREIQADMAATEHKLKFFENGATVNLALKFDPALKNETFQEWVQSFREQHEDVANAYKTLFLNGGVDPVPIGSTLQQMEFKVTQGAGETRIAAAAGVPPVIVGLSEGLQAATYSNYGQARRRFADQTMRPLWRNAAASLATVVRVPGGSELWYDDRNIPALREDASEVADIKQKQANTMRTLIEAGYEPDSVTAAVSSGDDSKLVHTGLISVQLQEPGTQAPDPSLNGNGAAALVAQT